MSPDGTARSIVPAEELILRFVVHVADAGLHPRHVDLITSNPAKISGPGLRVGRQSAMANQIGFAVRGMLHVLPEIHEMRRAHLYRLAWFVRLAK